MNEFSAIARPELTLPEDEAARVRAAPDGAWGGLRAGAYVRWQWHRIEPEALRALALELAAAEGLVVSG